MAGEDLFVLTHLESRMGRRFVSRVLDDDGTGEASDSAVLELIAEASATVWATLPKDYELPPEDITTLPPALQYRKRERPYLRKLALDYAQAALCQRHPEFQRLDALDMMKLALKSIGEYGAELIKDSATATEEGGGGIVSGGSVTGPGGIVSSDTQVGLAGVIGGASDWYR